MDYLMIVPLLPPQIPLLMEQQPQIPLALIWQQPQIQSTAARSTTAYAKAAQVAAIELYIGILLDEDRASLYNRFSIMFRKSLKAGTFPVWLKNTDDLVAVPSRPSRPWANRFPRQAV